MMINMVKRSRLKRKGKISGFSIYGKTRLGKWVRLTTSIPHKQLLEPKLKKWKMEVTFPHRKYIDLKIKEVK